MAALYFHHLRNRVSFFFLRNRSNTKDQKTGQNRDEILGWKLESKQRNSTLRFEIYVGDPIRL